MTVEKMALLELVQKSGGGDFLKQLAELVLQRLMQFEVDGLVGAARHESRLIMLRRADDRPPSYTTLTDVTNGNASGLRRRAPR
jgi:hypothetical protein